MKQIQLIYDAYEWRLERGEELMKRPWPHSPTATDIRDSESCEAK